MAPLTLGALPVVGVLLIFAMFVNGQDDLIDASNHFSFDLYQNVKKPSENLVVSPLSLEVGLALAYTGAGGNTEEQLTKVLHLPQDFEDVLKEYQQLLQGLQTPALTLATKMFIQETLSVKPKFQDRTTKYFQSEVGLVNFQTSPASAGGTVNQWVELTTNNHIVNFLAKESVNTYTRMVLANAVSFNKNWASPFNPALTKEEDFYVTPVQKVQVKMMLQENSFPYKHDLALKAQVLQLPYENKDFNMIVFLPDDRIDLPGVEERLAGSNFTAILQSLTYTALNVKLPKVKLEESFQLTETLKGLGIHDLFNQSAADLSGIADNLYVSAVGQKACIEVKEEGTVAADGAAPEVFVTNRSKRSTNADFVANHPFMYIITKGRTVLFMGRVIDPTQS